MTQKLYARYLLAIAVLHFVIGLLIFSPYLLDMINLGWVFSAGKDHLENAVASWFMLFTWPLVMVVSMLWQRETTVPNSFLVIGMIGSLLGVSIMPDSGFWFLVVLNAVALWQNRGVSNTKLNPI
jgi:hypothetical protein